MSYQFGMSRGRLPVGVRVDIHAADQAEVLREQTARILALAEESQELLAARHELALAKVQARRAAAALETVDERMACAEHVRAEAVERFGYDPVVCDERLNVATAERCRDHRQGRPKGEGL